MRDSAPRSSSGQPASALLDTHCLVEDGLLQETSAVQAPDPRVVLERAGGSRKPPVSSYQSNGISQVTGDTFAHCAELQGAGPARLDTSEPGRMVAAPHERSGSFSSRGADAVSRSASEHGASAAARRRRASALTVAHAWPGHPTPAECRGPLPGCGADARPRCSAAQPVRASPRRARPHAADILPELRGGSSSHEQLLAGRGP